MIHSRTHLASLYRSPPEPMSHLNLLRLDRNERIVPFPEEIIVRFKERMTSEWVMAYPELEKVYHELAIHFGVERDHLYLAAGSDLAIKTVYETYIDPGDSVLLHFPSYAIFEIYGQMFQANILSFYYNRQLSLDIDAYVDGITSQTRMVVLENPNGSIGTALPHDAIRAVVEKAHRCNTLVLLDEAYYMFSNQTLQQLYLEFDNVIIARTFSKDFGIAGLRCGYLLSQKQNIDSVYRVKPMHEITSATAAFVLTMLEFPEHTKQFVADVQAGITFTKESLRQIGMLSAGGSSNFIVIYLGEQCDLSIVVNYLKSRGILVRRPFQLLNLRGWLRVGCGNVEQMQRFVNAFAEALDVSGWKRALYTFPEGWNL